MGTSADFEIFFATAVAKAYDAGPSPRAAANVLEERLQKLTAARNVLRAFKFKIDGKPPTHPVSVARVFLGHLEELFPEACPRPWRCENCWLERLPSRTQATPCDARCLECRNYALASAWKRRDSRLAEAAIVAARTAKEPRDTHVMDRFFDGLSLLFRARWLQAGLELKDASRRARVEARNWIRGISDDEQVFLFVDFIAERCYVDARHDWWVRNGWRPSTSPPESPSTVTKAKLFAAYTRWFGSDARPGCSPLSRTAFFDAVEKNIPGIVPRRFGARNERGWSGIGLRRTLG